MISLVQQKVWIFLLSLLLLAHCGGDLGVIEGPYSVGGTLTGLSGTVVLQNNSGDDLTLTDDGSFTFETPVEDGETYAVTVLTQPDTKTCSVSNGSGTIEGDNVTDVSVVCATDTYTVGGTLSGLSGTVVLQNNSGDDLELTSDGTFTFAIEVADGAGYEVTVLTQPDTKTCSVSSGSGTINGADVTDVSVVCATDTYTVGGTLSGVSGTVVLQNNSGDNLSLTSNGTFTFATEVADGAAYAVTVLTQPSGQTCTVSSGSGTMDGANVTGVTVSCVVNIPSFSITPGSDNNGCTSDVPNFSNITITAQTASTITATASRFPSGTVNWSGTRTATTYTLVSLDGTASSGLLSTDCQYDDLITITGIVSPFSCTQITRKLTRTANDCTTAIDSEMTAPSGFCTDTYSSPTCSSL